MKRTGCRFRGASLRCRSRVRHCFLNGANQILGVKAKRSGLALIENMTSGRNKIEAVGPACIGTLHPVVEAIYHGRKLDPKLAYTCACYRGALCRVARAAEQDLILNVALHLPHVGGVCLKDIDCIEIDLILVLC